VLAYFQEIGNFYFFEYRLRALECLSILGLFLFFSGLIINIHSDHVLRNLRKPGEKSYKIPNKGLFHYVTGANYFGEILEWSGFAIASWSPTAAVFALFAALFLGQRSFHHHK
jgi:steroid 5-alpha reductase family enzyme